MNKYIKSEFKRAFFSISTLISIIVVFVTLIIPYISDLKFPSPGADGIDYFIRARDKLDISYLPVFAPLIVCIPFSTSYIADKESGILKIICTKIKFKIYLGIRLLVNAIISGIVLIVPQIVFLVYLLAMYGNNHGVNHFHRSYDLYGAFSNIYYSSKMEYAVLLIIVSFIFGVIYSSFALGISAVLNNKYLTIIIPFIYVIISGTIFDLLSINNIVNLNMICLFSISSYSDYTGLNYILYSIAIFLISSILLFYGAVKNNV